MKCVVIIDENRFSFAISELHGVLDYEMPQAVRDAICFALDQLEEEDGN